MKYKVINGFYDADKRRIIEKDEKIELDNSKAKQLMAKGLVTGIQEDAELVIEENGSVSVDGKEIGHVEGEDIVITDPEVIEETLKDSPVTAEEEAEEETEAKAEKKAKK